MKQIKNTATVLLLGLGIATTGQAEINLVGRISDNVEEIKAMTAKNAAVQEVFIAVVELTNSLKALNERLARDRQQIERLELSLLKLVDNALNYCVDMLKQSFETAIFTQFNAEFRALSGAKFAFNGLLREINENLNGIEIVKVSDLSFTGKELNELNQSLEGINDR